MNTTSVSWWDYFELREPQKILSTELETLTNIKSDLVPVPYKIQYENCENVPMWTKFGNNETIFINQDFELFWVYFYHEVGHLVHNRTYFQKYTINKNLSLVLAKCEYSADLGALKLANKKKHINIAEDLIYTTFIDRARPDIINEHFLARQKLIRSKEYLKLVNKYLDSNKLLTMAEEWYNLSKS